jgi:hypothetical protein
MLRVSAGALESLTSQAPRAALPAALPIDFWDAGAPNRAEPFYWGVAGREPVEIRVDGLPVGPVRWPETALSPVPLLAVQEVHAIRAGPATAPLASTGGSLIDLRLSPAARREAVSAVRLTRGSYGTFTEEVTLRRPVGPVLLSGFYGDTKSDGRVHWGRQDGQTLGARAVHRAAGGWASWGWDDATDRSRWLATKKGSWDRSAGSLRWWRGDSSRARVDVALTASTVRGRGETLLGITERNGRHLFLHATIETAAESLGWGAAVEVEGARVHLRRPGEAQALLEDLSYGITVTHRRLAAWDRRITLGVARFAPTAPSPIGSIDLAKGLTRTARIRFAASRTVRNRTLPRLPSDGSAWVLNGVGLAAERSGEAPEALWRGTLAVERLSPPLATTPAFLTGSAGVDALLDTRGLGDEGAWLDDLGIDGHSGLPPEAQRRDAGYLQPWGQAAARFGWGFSLAGHARGTLASREAAGQLGLPELSGRAALAWEGAIFRGDLGLRFEASVRARGPVSTPYGDLDAVAWMDGEAVARVGAAQIFWVLANAGNANERSLAFDGTFQPMPRRHYRAGLRWAFVN